MRRLNTFSRGLSAATTVLFQHDVAWTTTTTSHNSLINSGTPKFNIDSPQFAIQGAIQGPFVVAEPVAEPLSLSANEVVSSVETVDVDDVTDSESRYDGPNPDDPTFHQFSEWLGLGGETEEKQLQDQKIGGKTSGLKSEGGKTITSRDDESSDEAGGLQVDLHVVEENGEGINRTRKRRRLTERDLGRPRVNNNDRTRSLTESDSTESDSKSEGNPKLVMKDKSLN
jgi:hypothetical protein